MSRTTALRVRLDHLVGVSPNLDVASARLEALGFALGAPNGHPTLGTVNRLVLLNGAYLEALSVREATPATADLERSLATDTELVRVALSAIDARRVADQLAEAGLAATPLIDFRRPIDGRAPEGDDIGFKIVVGETAKLGGCRLFWCEHEQRSATLVTPPAHPNGATSILSIRAALGEPIAEARLATVANLDPGAPDAPAVDVTVEPAAGKIGWTEATIAVRDGAICRDCFERGGITPCVDGKALIVPAAPGFPLDLRFVETV